jgi:hypothetical protein
MNSKWIFIVLFVCVLIGIAYLIDGVFKGVTVAIDDTVQATLPVSLYDKPIGGKKVCDMASNEQGTVIDIYLYTNGSTDHRDFYRVSSLSTKCVGWSEVNIFHFNKFIW